MGARRALLIVNRKSRSGNADLSAASRVLRQHDVEPVERAVEAAGAIPEAIRAARDEVDTVIVAGGDGTLNAAAEALVETGLALGILPTGTGNDLARTLGIPANLEDAALVIATGRRHAIDVGLVNGRPFFNVASLGLSAELIRHHTAERKRRLWLFAYLLSVRDAWRHLRPFTVEIRCDGRSRRRRAIQVAIGNGRHYGGGMTIAEDAAIDDGRLDVYCLTPLPFWRLLALFPALRRGRLARRREVLIMRCEEIELTTRRAMPVNTDGELTTGTPARFAVGRRAVTVCVPLAEGARGEGGSEAEAHAAQ